LEKDLFLIVGDDGNRPADINRRNVDIIDVGLGF